MNKEYKGEIKMNKEEKVLLSLYECGEYDLAIKYIDETGVNPSVNDDYGLRYAMHTDRYNAVESLVKRGCKLSSVNYEAVNVFLEKRNKPNYMFEFIFSNVDLANPKMPSLYKILCSGNGITLEQLNFLTKLGVFEVSCLDVLVSNVLITLPEINIEPLLVLCLRHNVPLPDPKDRNRILVLLERNIELFEYYYNNNHKATIIEYFKKRQYLPTDLFKYIISNNITDIYSPVEVLIILLLSDNDEEVELSYIEDYIKANQSNIPKLEDSHMNIFCRDEYEGLADITEYDVNRVKLLMKYDLINIRAHDDLFYHQTHMTKSPEAESFIDSIYTLTIKQ